VECLEGSLDIREKKDVDDGKVRAVHVPGEEEEVYSRLYMYACIPIPIHI